MSKVKWSTGLLVSLFLVLPLTAIMYLGDVLLDLAFVPFDLFNWMTGILPGPLITFGIDMMIDTFLALGISVADLAKTAEQAIAIFQFVGLLFVAGLVFFELIRSERISSKTVTGLVAGTIVGLPLTVITLTESASLARAFINALWLGVLFLGWGYSFVFIFERLSVAQPTKAIEEIEPASVEQISRRGFLISLGATSATLTVVGAGLGVALSSNARRRLLGSVEDSSEHSTEGPFGDPFPNADDPVVPVPGTRPEYTPVKDHYQVFIEVEPTLIREEDWQLPVVGLVDNPLMLSLQDLRDNYPARNQYVTLSCISGRIGTSLISTTHWRGASVQDVLTDAQVRPEARYLVITSGDGFYETVDLELIRSDPRIMFCYEWDGNTLPMGHGFPLRIWIPDRYGMKQPKWITGLELVDEYQEGYWVERGWDETARVKTTSVIDSVAVDAIIANGGERFVPIGGIAFSGDKGISKVEVRVDGGSWQEAQLRTPLSETTWVVWRYEWPFAEGDHTFEVRCQEGDGTQQIEEETEARPSGATGIHSVDATL